jgi:hypothetical protein
MKPVTADELELAVARHGVDEIVQELAAYCVFEADGDRAKAIRIAKRETPFRAPVTRRVIELIDRVFDRREAKRKHVAVLPWPDGV